jgi:hypothetical protein
MNIMGNSRQKFGEETSFKTSVVKEDVMDNITLNLREIVKFMGE